MSSRPARSRRQQAAQQPESQSRAKWNASLTNVLVELMVEQVRIGNKQNKFFNKEAWRCICEEFHKETGLPWDQEQLRSRYIALRKHYVVVKSVLDHRDFEWDEQTGAIVGSNEAWDAYIKDHPDAETLRTSGCSTYQKLQTIFAETGTKAKLNGSAMGKERHSGSQPSSGSEEVADILGDEEDKLQTTNPSPNLCRKKGRKGADDFVAKFISEMAAASRLRAEAIKKFNEKYTITDCISALDDLQGVDDQVYFAALDLFNNRSAREIFLSLAAEKRLTWLQFKFSGFT